MSDAVLARYLVEKKLATSAAVEEARHLQAEMAAAGLSLGLDEILLRSGKIPEASRHAALGAIGLPAPALRVPANAAGDERFEAAVRDWGLVPLEDLVAIRAFQSWARDRGVALDLATILEKRGYLAADTVAGLLGDAGPARPERGTAKAARSAGRPATSRTRARTGRQSRAIRRRGPSKGLVIGLSTGGGALALLLVLFLVLASGGSPDGSQGSSTGQANPPRSRPAPPGSPDAERPDALADRERATDREDRTVPPAVGEKPEPGPGPSEEDPLPARDLDRELANLETRVDRVLSAGDAQRARDLVEAFRRSLANDEDWIAAGDRLAALDRKIEGALAAADGGEEPGGPGGGEEPGDGGGPGGEPGGVPKPEPRAPRAVSETPFRAARSMEELQRLYAEAQSIGRYDLAAQLCTEMIGLAPDRADLYLNRGVMHAFQGQYLPAIEDLDRAEARFRHGIEPQKFLVEIVSQRCQARAFGLQFNEAREDAKRLLEFDPGSAPLVHYLLGIAYKNEGDLDRAIQEYKAALEKGGGRLAVALDVGLCLLEKGDRARALDIFAQTERQFGANPSHARAAAACQAWAWADPAGPPGQDLARARAILDEKVPPELGTPYQYFITAAIYALEGDYPSALAWFRFKWSSWENLPTTGYLYAKAAQALGYEDEARQVLQKAIRMRPALAARYGVAATPEARVLQRAQEEAQEQAKATSATEILDRKAEQEDRVLRVEQIRTLEASYRFAEAAADFKVYARQATSDAARAEASGAAERAAALRGLHERLVARAAKGGLAEVPVRVGENRDARIVGGDERRAELRVGDGRATAPWGFLGLDDFLSLVETLSPKPAEWFALGTFALDQGLEVRAWAALDLARKEKSLRAAVDETIARHRGVPVPPGGFAFHLGQFVSAQEKEKLDSGLVLFRGEWVAPEDRERALKGYQKVRGEWTKLTEADLAARGWEKVGEEWLSPDELASRRGLWASAQERTTEHYALRSDRGAAFLEELGEVLEAAYKEFSTFFGREPSQDRRMVVLAFKDFEGYREYCHKLGRDDVLSALGFAPSEEWTCCGYDKFRDTRSFLQTLVHESTHLYFWVTFGAGTPSWLSEGMATYFEGFRKIGQRYEFHLPSEKRLAALRPVLSGASFELDPLLAGDAAQLINQSMNQALDFYARAWGLFYFLARSDNPAVREIFVEMMERAKAGGAIDLPGLVGDTRRAEFENVLVAFLRGT